MAVIQMAAEPLVILRPSGGSTPTPVRMISGAGSPECEHECPAGYICASGTWDQVATEDPDAVYGKVIAAGTAPPALNVSDPCTAQGEVRQDKTWEISSHTSMGQDIPCADCGDPPRPNRLVVWLTYPSGNEEVKSLDFNGACATTTECDQESGSGLTLLAQQSLESAPFQWQLDVRDFTAEKARVFNGSWTLKLTSGLHGVWTNGGGKKAPLIELRLDYQKPTEWQLLFKHGRFKVQYFQSSNNWIWTRANDLLYTAGDPAKKGVPPMVRVVPK